MDYPTHQQIRANVILAMNSPINMAYEPAITYTAICYNLTKGEVKAVLVSDVVKREKPITQLNHIIH